MPRDKRLHMSVVVNDETVVHITFDQEPNGRLVRSDGMVYDSALAMLRMHSDTTDDMLPCPLNRLITPTTMSSA